MIDSVLRIVGLDPTNGQTQTRDTPAEHTNLVDDSPNVIERWIIVIVKQTMRSVDLETVRVLGIGRYCYYFGLIVRQVSKSNTRCC